MSGKYFAPSKLVSAIRTGRLSGVIAAIDDGADIEEADIHGFTGLPLRTACFEGDLAIVRELLRCGADMNAMAADGPGAPLRLALRAGHAEVAALLVQHGAALPPGIALPADIIDRSGRPDPIAEEVAVPCLPQAPDDDADVEFEFEASAPFPGQLIEEVDVGACYGTDTNLLTLDLQRDQETTDTPPAMPPAGFWRTTRTAK